MFIYLLKFPSQSLGMSVHEFSSYSRIQKEIKKFTDSLSFAITLGLLTSSIDFLA